MSRLMLAGIGLSALCAATVGAYAVTQHDNDVFFAIPAVKSFKFAQTGHAITAGQPFGGVSSGVSKAGSEAKITVKAGRKGTSVVANWFKSKVGAGQTLVCDSKGTYPDDLNFAVEGTLTFVSGGKTVTCNNIVVAQGHFSTVNNWWMGGPGMQGTHIGPSGVTVQSCRAQGSAIPVGVTFAPQTPCSNHFNISVVDLSSVL